MSDKLIYGKYLVQGEGILVRDGGIFIHDNTIGEVGAWKTLKKSHSCEVFEFPDSIILPGLINSHTHLEIPGPTGDPMPFVPWLLNRIQYNQRLIDPTETVKTGITSCLKYGVACVGDIASRVAEVRRVLLQSPLRGISFAEIRAMGQRRVTLDEQICRSTKVAPTPTSAKEPKSRDQTPADVGVGATFSLGLSPHAPYSVEVSGYRRIASIGLPVTTHLAESPEEQTFLNHQQGPFRELWRNLPWWDDQIERFSGTPVELAKATGLLDAAYPVLLAHVNYCSDADLDLLQKSTATVVYCPRTHHFFGHPPHRFIEMRSRGINVVLGTDSLASTPDLDLMEEARYVHRLGVDAIDAIGMITWNAGKNFAKSGQIKENYFADLALFEAEDLEELMAKKVPAKTMLAGQWVG